MMISAARRCGGDDDDLRPTGLRLSRVRGREREGQGGAAPRARGCGSYGGGGGGGAAPFGKRGAARVRVRVSEVVRLGCLGGSLKGVPHPSLPPLYRRQG